MSEAIKKLSIILPPFRHHQTSPAGESTSETNVILVPQLETVFSRAARIIQRAWRTHVVSDHSQLLCYSFSSMVT